MVSNTGRLRRVEEWKERKECKNGTMTNGRGDFTQYISCITHHVSRIMPFSVSHAPILKHPSRRPLQSPPVSGAVCPLRTSQLLALSARSTGDRESMLFAREGIWERWSPGHNIDLEVKCPSNAVEGFDCSWDWLDG